MLAVLALREGVVCSEAARSRGGGCVGPLPFEFTWAQSGVSGQRSPRTSPLSWYVTKTCIGQSYTLIGWHDGMNTDTCVLSELAGHPLLLNMTVFRLLQHK